MPSTTSLISGPTKPSARSITPDSYCHSEDYSYLDSQTSSHPHPQTTFHHSNSSDYNLYHGTGAREFMTQPVAVYNQPQKDSADVDLPPLQAGDAVDKNDKLEPIAEDDPTSYNLVAPAEGERDEYSLEKRSLQLFSKEHLQVIFADPTYLLKFTSFLGAHRPQSVPILIHYLDALKALRTIQYSNAILEGLDPIDGIEFTKQALKPTINTDLEARADGAFDILVRDELPAFVTHQYINIVTSSIASRITGALSPYLREASEGLAEVFCLTDPSRPDNPIVFASEEFNRTTQYGMGYTIGRNCRFLQGPQTNSNSTRRFREMIEAGKPHQETFLNYRRDGSPFMNLLMCAPLTDSRGVVRYFIGAQVDVSGLVKDCVELESLSKLLDMQAKGQQPVSLHQSVGEIEDPLRDLAEMMNQGETTTIARFGGRMHREIPTNGEVEGENGIGSQTAPSHERILIKDPETLTPPADMTSASGRLRGIYQNYLLIRPYPALRILFASPSQRIPGLLQSPFLDKIGGSHRVREELTAAFADGRGVTAKVRWISKAGEDGRNKWIHCTPLQGIGGAIGVWMVVIVDDEKPLPKGAMSDGRRWRAPQILPNGLPGGSSKSSSVDGRRTQMAGAKRNGIVNGVHGGLEGPYTNGSAVDGDGGSNFSG